MAAPRCPRWWFHLWRYWRRFCGHEGNSKCAGANFQVEQTEMTVVVAGMAIFVERLAIALGLQAVTGMHFVRSMTGYVWPWHG